VFDSDFDAYAPPAPPPPVFDAALSWQSERYYAQILALDGDYSEHEYDINLSYGNDSVINLSWDNTDWSSNGTFFIQDAFGGAFFNIDMTDGSGPVNGAFASIDNTNPSQPVLSIYNAAVNLLKLKVTPLSPDREISIDIDQDNIVTLTYPEDWFGVETVTFTATDVTDAGLSDSDDAVFTVIELPNEPPVAEDISVDTDEDSMVEVSLAASDSDGDNLTFEITTDPEHGTVSESMFAHYYGDSGYGRVSRSGRDNPFEGMVMPTNLSGVFQGQAVISGVPASDGDWIAAFDEDGNIAGASELTVWEGIAYISVSIYGDDGTTPGIDEGINSGENFYLKLWDSSEDAISDYPDGFDCWFNNNGAPMTGCGSVMNVYDFVPVVVVGPSAGFNFVVDGLSVQLIDESVPGDNTIVSWSWDFGDGNSSSGQNPVHVYSASGTYDVTLLVTDAADMSDSISAASVTNNVTSQEVVHIVYYTPESDYNGDDSFGYRVFDGMEQSGEAIVSITITTVNDAPELAFINDQSTPEDSELVLTLSASDVDGDNLTYSAESSDENVQVTVSGDELTLSPAGDWNGSSTILATVTDGELTDSQAFVVTVTPVDDSPDVVDIPDQEIMEGDVFTSFDLDDYVSEVDGDVVDWSYSSGSDEVSGFVHHII
jgi:PKD repeat protein